MYTLLQSVFLRALGYAIVSSLAQMALLWLLMQMVLNVFTTTPRSRYHTALLTQLTGFAWFIITFCQQYTSAKSTPLLPGYGYVTVISSATWQNLYSALPWLSAVYLFLLVIFLIRWMNGYYYTTRLQRHHSVPATIALQQFVNERSAWMGITRNIQVYISENISSPLTTGFIRPLILIPLASINHLSITQLETVLLHELAHIKRLDFVWNMVLTIIETILFFNPFTYFIGKRIAREREYSCDDWVLQHNYQPVQYAEALLNIARLQNKPALALAAVDGKRQLTLRIKRMLGMQPDKRNYGYSLVALVGVAILSVFLVTTRSIATQKASVVTASPTVPVRVTDTLLSERTFTTKYSHSDTTAIVIEKKNKHPHTIISQEEENMIAPPEPPANDNALLDNTIVETNDLAPSTEPAITLLNSDLPVNLNLPELIHMVNGMQVIIPVKDLNVYKEVLRLQVNKVRQQADAFKQLQGDTLSHQAQVILNALRGNGRKLKEMAVKIQTLQDLHIQQKKDGTSIIIINGNVAGDITTGSSNVIINTIQ